MSGDRKMSEWRLRRLAAKQGLILITPHAYDRRGIGGIDSGYVSVPAGSGMTSAEVEAVLTRRKPERH